MFNGCDSVVTPFEGVLGETRETACTSVHFRKLSTLQETNVERFPKLDVAAVGFEVDPQTEWFFELCQVCDDEVKRICAAELHRA